MFNEYTEWGILFFATVIFAIPMTFHLGMKWERTKYED